MLCIEEMNMKKTVKSVISILLCAVMLSGICITGFAAEEKTAFIAVSGMNTFPLYDGENNKVYPLSTSTILEMVGKLLPPVMSYLVTKDADKLADKIFPVLRDVFGVIACNPDGTSVMDIHTDTFASLVGETAFEDAKKDEEGIVNAAMKKYGAENTFFFNYDWRLDPLDHADDLNLFIRKVREETKCDRLALACFSMGGTVTLSYLAKYGSEDVDSVEFCSTAFQGTSVVGELYKGDVEVSLDGLFKRLAQLTRNDTLEQIIYYLNDGLNKNGFNTKVSDWANDLVASVKDRLYDELLVPVFGSMPGMWAMAPEGDYEADMAFMFPDGANEKLLERTEAYREIQKNAKNIIEEAMNDTNMYIFAQYNMAGLPVTPAGSHGNNDYLIDCIYASGGATCSLLGETLGDGYTQKLYPERNYLSPDGQIDASTCLFPEITWFIRDMGHVDYPVGGASDFVFYFADEKQQKTVSDCEYSQFLTYSNGSKTLTPVTGEESNNITAKILSFFYGIRNFFYEILARIKGIFSF